VIDETLTMVIQTLVALKRITTVVYFRLPPEDAGELRHYAAALRMSTSHLVRSLVHSKLEEARATGALRIVEAHTVPITPGRQS
jgi:hypothetical protein